MKYFVLFSFAFFLLSSCSTPSHTSRTYRSSASKASTPAKVATQVLINFNRSSSMQAAMEDAQSSGKYIFLDFYTDYCPPCKVMDKEVFGNPALANYINDNFISVKVNGGKTEGANLASLFEVRAFPTLIFTDEKGNVLTKREGGASISTVRQMAERALRATAMR